MKSPTIVLAAVNTLPLVIYVFIAVPLAQMLGANALVGESLATKFFFYGFVYAALAYPLVLLFNHASAFLNYRKHLFKVALINEVVMSSYLVALLFYGVAAYSFIS